MLDVSIYVSFVILAYNINNLYTLRSVIVLFFYFNVFIFIFPVNQRGGGGGG